MNFCVYLDSGAEVQGYFVPDGFSTEPRIHVRINGSDQVVEIATWIFIEGARAQGAHETGNVGFVLNDTNVPGISVAKQVEISDPKTGLIFYRRAQPGQFIPKKVLRLETGYVPSNEIDSALKPYFQFYEDRIEHYGFETVRQMLEIIHQPSVYVSGRILLKNFRLYIDYNIDITMISLRDPFYELATRLIVFGKLKERTFSFVSERDRTLFKPVIDWLHGVPLQDAVAINKAIRAVPSEVISLLSSPFTQQLVAASPTDGVTLDDVSRALDALSQFTIFDSGRDPTSYVNQITDALNLPKGLLSARPQLEPIHQLADILRMNSRVEHLLEADLVLYHFIQKAETRVSGS